MSYRPDGWNAGNDGSGSGLDADKLDNLSSADFALVAHGHDLNALDDVTIGVLNTGDVLMWDGVGLVWEEHTPAWVADSDNATITGAWTFTDDLTISTGIIELFNFAAQSRFRAYAAQGTSGSPTNLTAGNWIGGLQFWGYENTAADYVLGGGIRGVASESWTAGVSGMDMLFFGTTDGASAQQEFMRYDATLDVVVVKREGLLIDNTTGFLEIQSTEDAKIILRDDGTAAWNFIAFYDQTDRHGYVGFGTGNEFLMVNEESTGAMQLQTNSGDFTINTHNGGGSDFLLDSSDLLSWGGGDGAPSSNHIPMGVKLTNQTYNGTTFTSAGSITVGQTGFYRVEVSFRYFSTVSTDWKIRLRHTSTATGYYAEYGNMASGSGASTVTLENSTRTMIGSGGVRYVAFVGYMDIQATGDFHCDLAESSGTSNFTLYDGAIMTLTRVDAT